MLDGGVELKTWLLKARLARKSSVPGNPSRQLRCRCYELVAEERETGRRGAVDKLLFRCLGLWTCGLSVACQEIRGTGGSFPKEQA